MSKSYTYAHDFTFVQPTVIRPGILRTRPVVDPMLRPKAPKAISAEPGQVSALRAARRVAAVARPTATVHAGLDLRWLANWRAFLPDKYKRYTVERGVKVRPTALRTQSGVAVLAAVLALGTASVMAPADNGTAGTPPVVTAGSADDTVRMVTSVRQDAVEAGQAVAATPTSPARDGTATTVTTSPTVSAASSAPAASSGSSTAGSSQQPLPGNGGIGGGGSTDGDSQTGLPAHPVTDPAEPREPEAPAEEAADPAHGGAVDALGDVVDGVTDGLGGLLGL